MSVPVPLRQRPTRKGSLAAVLQTGHFRDPYMKVAYIVTRADSFGGAQAHVLDLAQALRAGGGEPVVLAGGDGPFAAELRRRHVPCIEIRHLVRPVRPARDALALLEILAALRRIPPD